MQTPSKAILDGLNIGVDVAKEEVVVACDGDTFTSKTIPNQIKALQAWLKSLPVGGRVAMEATGCYFETLARLAFEQGLTVFVLNPLDVHHYAQGIGQRGKTDRVDARMIARYIAREHGGLHAYVPPTPEQRDLDRLIKRRATLVTSSGAIRQCLEGLTALGPETKALFDQVKAMIDRIDVLIKEALRKLPAQWQTFQLLKTIKGVGSLTGAYLTNTFARLPFSNVNAFIAHTGLDPRPMDSGKKQGRRRLSKRGPSELRRLLYICAMAAARSTLWKPFYAQQRAKGLSSTAALVVLARKIARIAFAVFKRQTPFDPDKIAFNH